MSVAPGDGRAATMSDPPPSSGIARWRLRAADLMLALLLLWAVGSWAIEVHRAVRDGAARAGYQAPPALWRFGTPATQRLRHCIARATSAVPPGELVRLYDPRQDFFRWRW